MILASTLMNHLGNQTRLFIKLLQKYRFKRTIKTRWTFWNLWI